jgi:hypothetical protein
MTKINRRKLLAAAGTTAAGAVIPSAVSAAGRNPTPSAELLEWRSARAAYWQATERSHAAASKFAKEYLHASPHLLMAASASGEFPFASQLLNQPEFSAALLADPAVSATGREEETCRDRLDAAVAALVARPVRSWVDVAEIAEMWWSEHRWLPGERREDDDNNPGPNDRALFNAIVAMGGGANV